MTHHEPAPPYPPTPPLAPLPGRTPRRASWVVPVVVVAVLVLLGGVAASLFLHRTTAKSEAGRLAAVQTAVDTLSPDYPLEVVKVTRSAHGVTDGEIWELRSRRDPHLPTMSRWVSTGGDSPADRRESTAPASRADHAVLDAREHFRQAGDSTLGPAEALPYRAAVGALESRVSPTPTSSQPGPRNGAVRVELVLPPVAWSGPQNRDSAESETASRLWTGGPRSMRSPWCR